MLGKLVVHENEHHGQASNVSDGLRVGPRSIGDRPDQQAHLDDREHHGDDQPDSGTGGARHVLGVAAPDSLGGGLHALDMADVDLAPGLTGSIGERHLFLGQRLRWST